MVEQLTAQLEQAKQSAVAQLDEAAAVNLKATQVRSVAFSLFPPRLSEQDHLQHRPALPWA